MKIRILIIKVTEMGEINLIENFEIESVANSVPKTNKTFKVLSRK